jgi:hypothetical protein
MPNRHFKNVSQRIDVFQEVGALAPTLKPYYYWALAAEEIRPLDKGICGRGTVSLSTFNFQLSTYSDPRGLSCP